jgi:OLD-like protein
VAHADQYPRGVARRRETIPPGGPAATRRALDGLGEARAVVLVEGLSDQIALEALAAKRGIDVAAAGAAILPMGGAHAVGRFVDRFPHTRVAGLCDAGERDVFRRAGIPDDQIFVCNADLEDELTRAHGAHAVLALLAEHGDASAFRTFQRQPAWRGRPLAAQLRRFFGSADRRKLRYARILVSALDEGRVPPPLAGALAYALSPGVTTPAS